MEAATLDRTDLDPRVARLLDKDACRELVHKFARAIDRCDAALIGEILHPDATDDHGGFKGTGKDFVPWVMDVPSERSRHCTTTSGMTSNARAVVYIRWATT